MSISKRVAIISPVGLLERYSTDFHLVLTQYYLKNEQYRDFYLKRSLAGDVIILDNGAAELKTAVEGFSMMDVVKELQPDIVVAPDVIYSHDLTLERTMEFLGRYALKLHRLGIGIMAVPQGESVNAWRNCFDLFNVNQDVDWLGISMFYTPKFNKRLEALRLIAPTVQKPCHLLGLWNNPYDLLEERKFDFVKSVDTAKPVEFALEGLTLAGWAEHEHLDNDWYFRVDYLVDWEQRLADKNVADFVKLFKEGVK